MTMPGDIYKLATQFQQEHEAKKQLMGSNWIFMLSQKEIQMIQEANKILTKTIN